MISHLANSAKRNPPIHPLPTDPKPTDQPANRSNQVDQKTRISNELHAIAKGIAIPIH